MGSESFSNPAVNDFIKPAVVNDQNQDSLLHKLQVAAGLQDSDLATKLVKVADKAKDSLEDYFHKDLPGDLKPWFKEAQPPSEKERADAEKALEGRTSKLIPEADRQVMKEMTTALTNGDTKAFAEACKHAGGNPEKLKALVSEVDKMLEEKNCSTRLDVTADGKVLVHDALGSTALSFDPKTGGVEAKSVEHNIDGSVLVKPGELLHVDTDKQFHGMGDSVVDDINGKGLGNIKLEPISGPFEPLKPHRPWIDPPFWGGGPIFKPDEPIKIEDEPAWRKMLLLQDVHKQ